MLSQKTINKIIEVYNECGNKAETARRVGVSAASVGKYVSLDPRAAPPAPSINCDKINEVYQKVKTLKETAEITGYSISTVRKYLNKESLKILRNKNEDKEALFYYIINLFNEPPSTKNITLMERYSRKGMSYKAQLLTLKYFYEVRGNKVKDEYHTIGIIPSVFNEAEMYYKTQENRQKEIEEGLRKQLEQDRITIQYNPDDYIGRKKKKLIDIDSIEVESE